MLHKQLIISILSYFLESTDNVGNLYRTVEQHQKDEKRNFIKVNYHVKHVKKKRVGTSNKQK